MRVQDGGRKCTRLNDGADLSPSAAFCFNRNDLHPFLQNKVDLTIFVRIVARLNLELPTKLLQDIVFSKRSFELIVSFQKNCTVIDACHVLEKAGIKYKQLNLIQLIKCGQRMLDLVK